MKSKYKCSLGSFLWLAAAVALIMGWRASGTLLGILGMDFVGWLLTSVALGVLALGCYSKGNCGNSGSCCGKGGGSCSPCGKCQGKGCESCK